LAITKDKRLKVEKKIYDVMNIMDPTGQNTEYYKKKFAKMNDKQFYDFFKQDFPLKFQYKPFEIDPTMDTIMKALQSINVPINEEVNMPFLYTNSDGVPVKSQKVCVVYLPLKRMKQMVVKKSAFSTDISKRDYKTGNLIDTDKNSQLSDREVESLAVMNLENTMDELITVRGDAMNAKNEFYNEINAKGQVSMSEVEVTNSDSIARNLISAYLLSAHIQSNLVNTDYFLPRTLKKQNAEQKGLHRE